MSSPIVKSVYVNAKFRPLYKEVSREVPTGEAKTGIFNKAEWVTETVTELEYDRDSDCEINGEQLTEDVAAAVETLITEGYEILSITPVTSGRWKHNHQKMTDGGWGYGYGYSLTDGMSIIAKKLAD